MPTSRVSASRWAAGVAVVLLFVLVSLQTSVSMAAPQLVAQGVPTPTPFRFLTPTPFTLIPSTTTTTTTTMPRAGGFPVELAIPVLAAGAAAIGGGATLLRRKRR